MRKLSSGRLVGRGTFMFNRLKYVKEGAAYRR